jgi:branched-chain amino acid transport system substrate-binding protein
MRKLGLGVLVLVAALVLNILPIHLSVGTASAAPKELVIGSLMGLSGPGSEQLGMCAEGQKVAAEWINSKGGITIKGEKYLVKLVGEDDKMSPDGTVAAANKLVFEHKVKFMLGVPIPPFRFAAEPITGPNKVLRMDMSIIGDPRELNANTPYTFANVSTPVGGSGEPLLDYFFRTYPHVKKVAMVAVDDPGGYALNKELVPQLEKRGISVVAQEYYPFGTADYYPMWTKILPRKPDAIMIVIGFAAWNGAVLKQGRELGFKGPFLQLTYPSGEMGDILKVAGKEFTTDYVTAAQEFSDPQAMTPLLNEWTKLVKTKLGKDFTTDHQIGFDTLYYIVQAVEKAQSLDPTVVKDTLEKMTDLKTSTGPGKMGGLKTFGINHVVLKPLPISRFVNGEARFVKWFMPDIP